MKSRMQDFALPKEAAESGCAEFATDCPEIVRASRNLGRERPSKPKLPARMTSRRDRDNARPRFWQPVSSMGLVRGIRGCLNGGCVRSRGAGSGYCRMQSSPMLTRAASCGECSSAATIGHLVVAESPRATEVPFFRSVPGLCAGCAPRASIGFTSSHRDLQNSQTAQSPVKLKARTRKMSVIRPSRFAPAKARTGRSSRPA